MTVVNETTGQYLDSAGSWQATPQIAFVADADVSWQRHAFSFLIPTSFAATDQVTARLAHGGADGTSIYYDDVALESLPANAFHHRDHVGSLRVATDALGGVISSHDYYPFGTEITPADNPDTTGGSRMRFTEHERDEHTQLDYMLARYGAASVGRFCSVDEIVGTPANSQSWNRYSYVYNNPMGSVDVDGRDPAKALEPQDQERIRQAKDIMVPLFEAMGMSGAEETLTYYKEEDRRWFFNVFGSIRRTYYIEYKPRGNQGGASSSAYGFQTSYFAAKTERTGRSDLNFEGERFRPGAPQFTAMSFTLAYVHFVKNEYGRSGPDVVEAAVAATFTNASALGLSKSDIRQYAARVKNWVAPTGMRRAEWRRTVDKLMGEALDPDNDGASRRNPASE